MTSRDAMVNRIYRWAYCVAYRAALVYWFIFQPSSRGAYVAVWHGNRILLIQNSYKSLATFPAGGVKRHETPREAAVRELQEEVGLWLPPDRLKMTKEFQSRQEFKKDYSIVFETTVDSEPPLQIDGREVIAAEFVDASEACDRRLTSVVDQYFRWKGLF